MRFGINTKVNSCGKVISSCLEDYKTTLSDFYKQHVFKQHWAKINPK